MKRIHTRPIVLTLDQWGGIFDAISRLLNDSVKTQRRLTPNMERGIDALINSAEQSKDTINRHTKN